MSVVVGGEPVSVMILTDQEALPKDLCVINLIHMKPNMGNADRLLRIIAAVAIAVLYFTGVLQGTLGLVLLVVAGVFALTSFVSFCPLYTLFGLRTRK